MLAHAVHNGVKGVFDPRPAVVAVHGEIAPCYSGDLCALGQGSTQRVKIAQRRTGGDVPPIR